MSILRVLRRPFVVHVRGSEFQDFYGAAAAWDRLVIRRTLSWAERGIVLTPSLAHLYDGLLPSSKVRVLENAIADPYPSGIDDLVSARRSRAREKPQALRLLYMANDWGMKGALTLVRSLATPGLESVELRMAGGPLEADLDAVRRLAGELGVAERLTVLGSISGGAKAEQFAWADALAHPTESWDGQPIVIIEAMAAGLPIVSTEYAGIPHTVGNAGLIVPPRAPEELGAAFRSLIEDAELRLRLGDSSRDRFLTQYSPEPYQRRFVALFGELVPCAE